MSGLEHATSGENLARKQQQEGQSILSLENPQVQVFLAKLAFPHEEKPLNKWLTENSYSSRYRAYIEDPARTESEKQVDITNEHALVELLEAVTAHAPETVH